MRQAGRYLPEYRALRANVSFLDLCKDPALAAEVTLQPLRRFGFDAAILFSDLLVPLEPMGLEVAFTELGPSIANPVRSASDVERLHDFAPAQGTPFVLETIKRLRPELDKLNTPLIGFAGAPFTVATYAIEGKTSKRFIETKRLFYTAPEASRRLLDKLAETTARYLLAQVEAGAQAIQIFDSWVGVVSAEDWERFVLPPTRALVQAVRASGVPVIYFPNGATTLLDRVANVGADVYGIDWHLPLSEARLRLAAGGAPDAAVQGNLDPALLLGPRDEVVAQARRIVEQGQRRGHVFNLGHGIYPDTPLETVEALVHTVKNG